MGSTGDSGKTERPTPADFDEFLPWACANLEVDVAIIITKTVADFGNVQGSRMKATTKAQKAKEPSVIISDEQQQSVDQSKIADMYYGQPVVCINTVYDVQDDLMQIKFLKSNYIPRKLLQIMALIVQFYPRLSAIHVNGGLSDDGLFELSKIVNMTKITDVILDNTVIPQANFYVLLEQQSCLNYLSLARCSLTDAIIETLVPLLLRSNIAVLNLSTNKITDDGAKLIGEMLRTNRKILYLNLAGNMIGDKGAESILSSLCEFPLTPERIYENRCKKLEYLKQLQSRPVVPVSTSPPMGEDVKTRKKSTIAKFVTKKNKSQDADVRANDPTLEILALDKKEHAIRLVEPHNPFKAEDTFYSEDKLYCYGNNVLSYLNLAYNNLTYLSIKKLCEVLQAQESQPRVAKGLISVCIEGNFIPETCFELREIENIIKYRMAFNTVDTQTQTPKKKTGKGK